MKTLIRTVFMVVLVSVVAGCDSLLDLLTPSTVTVTLVNESADFTVEGTLFYHDDEHVLELLIRQVGTESDFTLPAQQSTSFVRSCDDLQAIIIDDADLRLLGSIGPETSTDVLRMDDDFECGDEIVFTFSHSRLLPTDFDVTVTTR